MQVSLLTNFLKSRILNLRYTLLQGVTVLDSVLDVYIMTVPEENWSCQVLDMLK